jgi:hypothetical protein
LAILRIYEFSHVIYAYQAVRRHALSNQCCTAIFMRSWEEPKLGTKAMTTRSRPIHSGFETLRHASELARTAHGFRQFAATNEQITARGTGASRIVRPTTMFAEFRAC